MTADIVIELPRLPGEPDEEYEKRLRSERAKLGHKHRKEREAQSPPEEERSVSQEPTHIPAVGEGLAPTSAQEPVGVKATVDAVNPSDEKARTFHFIEDGMTILGKVWFRGEQVTLIEDSADWKRTVTGGRSLFDLTDAEQIERFEKVMFREGVWPGRSALTEAEYAAAIAGADEESRRRMEKRRQREMAVGFTRS